MLRVNARRFCNAVRPRNCDYVANERRLLRYKGLLRNLVVPISDILKYNGQEYQLPYRVQESAVDRGEIPDEASMKVIAMCLAVRSTVFFSSGCPVIQSCRKEQTIDRLVQFVHLFGGRLTRGKGPWQGAMYSPSFKWTVSGEQARRAARLLSSVPSGKRELFEFISRSKELSISERKELTKNGSALGYSEDARVTSWEQAAGLFDVQGSVTLPGRGYYCMRLFMTSNNQAMLQSLRDFLHSHGYPAGNVFRETHRMSDNSWQWRLESVESAQRLMSKLFPRLVEKKAIATIVLNFTRENMADMYKQTLSFKGRQPFFKRADDHAASMVKRMNSLRSRIKWARRVSRHQDAQTLTQELEELLQTKDKHMVQVNIERSRGLIRDALSRGGQLRSNP